MRRAIWTASGAVHLAAAEVWRRLSSYKDAPRPSVEDVVQLLKVYLRPLDCELLVAHDGEEALAVLKRGSMFGEMAVFDKSERSTDAISHGGTTALTISRSEFVTGFWKSRDVYPHQDDAEEDVHGFLPPASGTETVREPFVSGLGPTVISISFPEVFSKKL